MILCFFCPLVLKHILIVFVQIQICRFAFLFCIYLCNEQVFVDLSPVRKDFNRLQKSYYQFVFKAIHFSYHVYAKRRIICSGSTGSSP